MTDGILDNLWPQDIEKITREWQRSPQFSKNTTALAEAIKNLALEVSQMPNVRTPFAAKAEHEGFIVPGGKSDDIAVVAATMSLSQNAKEQGGGSSSSSGRNPTGSAAAIGGDGNNDDDNSLNIKENADLDRGKECEDDGTSTAAINENHITNDTNNGNR
mmetsp:Transcript_37987/g.60997  ORF Transcript_37987/g.60997 Transcript_37987/m.60997 type:complete len:160 (-) Transcript_37987:39-518(-)